MNKERIIKYCNYLIEACLLGIVFVVPLIFAFFLENYSVFELNKILVFKILLVIAFVVYTLKVFVSGKMEYKTGIKNIILPLFLLFFAYTFSTIISIHPSLSFWGGHQRQQGLLSFIFYFLFFALLVLNIKEWRQVKRLILAVLASSFLVSFYALLQYFGFDPWDWKESSALASRVFSTLGQPNFLGHYLVMTIPLAIYSLVFIFKKNVHRFLVLILILFQLAALILTYSRSAMLGFLASIYVFLLLFFYIKKRKKSFYGLIAVLLIFSVILGFAVKTGYERNTGIQGVNFKTRMLSIFNFDSGSTRMRVLYWQDAIEELKKSTVTRIIFGHGPESQQNLLKKHYAPEWGVHEAIDTFPDRAHNAILDTLLQFGVAGLLINVIFIFLIYIKALDYLKNGESSEKKWLIIFLLSALAGYYINNLFSFSLTAVFIYYFLFLSILVILSDKYEKKNIDIGFIHPILRTAVGIFLILFLIIFLFYYNFKPFAADFYFMKAKKAEAKSDCRGVLENIYKTAENDYIGNYYKENYINLAVNCASSLDNDQKKMLGENILNQAALMDIKELSYNGFSSLASAYTFLGDNTDKKYYKNAEDILNKLVSINPYVTGTWLQYGRLKLGERKYDEAIIYLNKALKAKELLADKRINDDHKKDVIEVLVPSYEAMGFAYNFKRDFDRAIYYYTEGLKLNPYYFPLYKKLADAYYQKGDLDKTVYYNKRGETLNSENPEWKHNLDILHREKGK